MKKEKTSSADRQRLEIIFADYPFFLRVISTDNTALGAKKEKRLQQLIDERDFFSIKQLVPKLKK